MEWNKKLNDREGTRSSPYLLPWSPSGANEIFSKNSISFYFLFSTALISRVGSTGRERFTYIFTHSLILYEFLNIYSISPKYIYLTLILSRTPCQAQRRKEWKYKIRNEHRLSFSTFRLHSQRLCLLLTCSGCDWVF